MLEFERLIMINIGIRNGFLHPDTVEQSQRLDVFINTKMKRRKQHEPSGVKAR